jgi:hypothetical protein
MTIHHRLDFPLLPALRAAAPAKTASNANTRCSFGSSRSWLHSMVARRDALARIGVPVVKLDEQGVYAVCYLGDGNPSRSMYSTAHFLHARLRHARSFDVPAARARRDCGRRGWRRADRPVPGLFRLVRTPRPLLCKRRQRPRGVGYCLRTFPARARTTTTAAVGI